MREASSWLRPLGHGAGLVAAALIVFGVVPMARDDGRDAWEDGVLAYDDERVDEALRAFVAAEQEVGHAAPAGLVYGRALAALGGGDVRAAEWSAEKVAARAADLGPVRDFVLGHAAFLRSSRAKAEAGLAEADPTAFDRAILYAGTARAFWQRAAVSREDWGAARRNVERVVRELELLRRMREEAARQRRAKKERQPEPQPEPETDVSSRDRPGRTEEEVAATAQAEPGRSAALVDRLLARLVEVEKEKRALRRAQRKARTSRVEKDW